MTSQRVKFYKFSSSASASDKITAAKGTQGAIIYIVDLKELWIGGATANAAELVLKGANDVTFTNNILTVTHYDNTGTATTQNLDFNDVASASQTFHVFEKVYNLMGTTPAGEPQTQTIDYTGTNYLSDLGGQGKPAKNLVNADKVLDAAIHDNTTMSADSTAVYDTEHLSSTWTTVVEANEISQGDAVTADVEKLDKKLAQLANEVIANEQVTNEAFTAVANSVGLESDMSLDLSGDTTGIIHDDTNVKKALQDLADAIDNNELDVQVEGTSIVNDNVANLGVADSYNASTNKIATVATVTNAIDALDVTEYAQAEIDTTTTSGETAFKVKGIKEVDGEIEAGTNTVDLKIDGTYDATNNKIATESTVTTAINDLDVAQDKGAASISGSTITINAVQQENGLIKDGGSTTINLDGTYNASDNKIATESTVSDAIDAIAGAGLAVDADGVVTATTQQTSDDTTNVATTEFVHNVVETLDTQADVQAVDYTAATSSTGAKLTFKGVSETNGIIAQGSGATELQFAKVATTGAAEDVSIADAEGHTEQTTVEGAIDEIYHRIEAMEGSFDVIKSTNAATTPYNVTWIDNTDPEHPQTVTGTLEASDDTFHKIYLVPVDSTGTNKYAEYITTKDTSGQTTTYDWERLGTIDVDLTGYVKSVTVNGKQYLVDSNSTNITLTDVITSIVGETAISGGDENVVKVEATTVKDTTNGTNITTLSTTAKIEEVADGIVKDSTASYTEGHYVIENGKLVSAAGKSTGDTYTISANDGLTKASDVKAYVDTTVETAVTKAANSPAVYDTTADEISEEWIDVVEHNEIKAGDSFEGDIDKLDKKIAGLADELIRDEEVTNEAFNAVANSVGLEDDLTLDLSAATLNIIKDDRSVKEALIDLDAAFAGKVDDVRINDTTIVANKIANLAVEGTYNASTNKIATQSTVSDAINLLDVNEYAQASVDVDSTNHTSALKIKGIKEVDGKIAAATTTPTTDVAIDGEYDASTNKIATKSTVTNAINALDANPTSDDNAVATVQVVETDGVITDVVVTNVSAGVQYTQSTSSTQPNLTASTATGAVTGADIATIKSYVDDKATLCWEEYE